MPVLDSSFLIDVARGHAGARALRDELVASGEPMLIPAIVVTEMLAGSRNPKNDLKQLRQAASLVPFTIEDAVEAGALARTAQQEGRFPGWNDVLIQASANTRGQEIVSRNTRHFEEAITY